MERSAFRCRLGLVGGVGGDGEIEFPLKGCAYCPLVRGNQGLGRRSVGLDRSIPAWAGEPRKETNLKADIQGKRLQAGWKEDFQQAVLRR